MVSVLRHWKESTACLQHELGRQWVAILEAENCKPLKERTGQCRDAVVLPPRSKGKTSGSREVKKLGGILGK